MFWRNKWSETRLALLESRIDAALTHIAVLEKRFDASTPALVRADLDDLRSAVDVDRIAHRKQLAKVWGRIGYDERAREPDISTSPGMSGEPELDAFIALQRSHGGQ